MTYRRPYAIIKHRPEAGRLAIGAKRKQKDNMKTSIEIAGQAVGQVIAISGKFAAAEHKAAMQIIAKDTASDPTLMVEALALIGNVSAISQAAVKAGLIKASATELSALQRQMVIGSDTAHAKK